MTSLPTAALGASGIQVGTQGLGRMGISDAYGPSDLTESRATLDRALELDVTLFDMDPIADEVAGDRYADMSFTSVGRE